MPFLTAHWENVVLINDPCPAPLLEPLVPAGTELDTWGGRTLVSLVGFLFADTRLLGVPIPFHRTFEEVNLAFASDDTAVPADTNVPLFAYCHRTTPTHGDRAFLTDRHSAAPVAAGVLLRS